jgi:hypothetical protein
MFDKKKAVIIVRLFLLYKKIYIKVYSSNLYIYFSDSKIISNLELSIYSYKIW